METADLQALERASRQGTILEIRVNRTTYGRGGFRGPKKKVSPDVWIKAGFAFTASIAAALSVIYLCKTKSLGQSAFRWLRTALYWIKDKLAHWGRKWPALPFAVREHYHIEDDPTKQTESYCPPQHHLFSSTPPNNDSDHDSVRTFETAPMGTDAGGEDNAETQSVQTLMTATETIIQEQDQGTNEELQGLAAFVSLGWHRLFPVIQSNVVNTVPASDADLDASANLDDSQSIQCSNNGTRLEPETGLPTMNATLDDFPCFQQDTSGATAPSSTTQGAVSMVDAITAADQKFDEIYTVALDTTNSLAQATPTKRTEDIQVEKCGSVEVCMATPRVNVEIVLLPDYENNVDPSVESAASDFGITEESDARPVQSKTSSAVDSTEETSRDAESVRAADGKGDEHEIAGDGNDNSCNVEETARTTDSKGDELETACDAHDNTSNEEEGANSGRYQEVDGSSQEEEENVMTTHIEYDQHEAVCDAKDNSWHDEEGVGGGENQEVVYSQKDDSECPATSDEQPNGGDEVEPPPPNDNAK
jgi:hypothetical protein